MRCRHCNFPRGLGENMKYKLYLMESHLLTGNFFTVLVASYFLLVHYSSSNMLIKIANKYYWRVKCNFEVISNKYRYCFSNVSDLTLGKLQNTIAHQKTILKVKIKVEVLSQTKKYSFYEKIYFSCTCPFKKAFVSICLSVF